MSDAPIMKASEATALVLANALFPTPKITEEEAIAIIKVYFKLREMEMKK